jgi:hypothetical protein|tara:strand:+ start:317 stop:643 length:327 start_codon:yes stop_codon:yes gene_type:complete
MPKTLTHDQLIERINKLKKGESLVCLAGENGSFFLHIGDKTVSNTWAVTEPELIELRDILNRKFPHDDPFELWESPEKQERFKEISKTMEKLKHIKPGKNGRINRSKD